MGASRPAATTATSGELTLEGVVKRFGEVAAVDDVSLQVAPGEFVSLLGPSGSGKTTTLRVIAGFLQVDRGRVVLDARDLTHVPPHRRNIGMVFQNYALFPHLSAGENVAFPLRMRRLPGNEVRHRVADAMKLVQLEGLEARYPRQLSGGQQQRVALARAIVFSPALLLMDEPLGALDKKLRESLQLEISRIRRQLKITVIYVTHDQEEALAMSDRIAIYSRGRIDQIGTPEDLYRRPRSLFTAKFMGESTIFKGELEHAGGEYALAGTTGRIRVTQDACRQNSVAVGAQAAVVVRPEHMHMWARGDRVGDPGSVRERWAAEIEGVIQDSVFRGSTRKYVVRWTSGELATVCEDSSGGREHAIGESVTVAWLAEDAAIVPDER